MMNDEQNGQINLIEEARALLSSYMDDEVTPAERELVETVLTQSPELQNELAGLRQTIQWVQDLPRTPAPRPFTLTEADVGLDHHEIEKSEATSVSWWAWLKPAIGGLAILAVIVIIGAYLFNISVLRPGVPEAASIARQTTGTDADTSAAVAESAPVGAADQVEEAAVAEEAEEGAEFEEAVEAEEADAQEEAITISEAAPEEASDEGISDDQASDEEAVPEDTAAFSDESPTEEVAEPEIMPLSEPVDTPLAEAETALEPPPVARAEQRGSDLEVEEETVGAAETEMAKLGPESQSDSAAALPPPLPTPTAEIAALSESVVSGSEQGEAAGDTGEIAAAQEAVEEPTPQAEVIPTLAATPTPIFEPTLAPTSIPPRPTQAPTVTPTIEPTPSISSTSLAYQAEPDDTDQAGPVEDHDTEAETGPSGPIESSDLTPQSPPLRLFISIGLAIFIIVAGGIFILRRRR